MILSSPVILQLSEKLGKALASQRRNDEELKDMREKNDQVAHWEGQIGEIIKWYVRVGFDYEGILRICNILLLISLMYFKFKVRL